MDKETLEILKKSSYWEDQFILKYDTESFWELLKSLGEEKYNRIRVIFTENLKETEKHYKMISLDIPLWSGNSARNCISEIQPIYLLLVIRGITQVFQNTISEAM